MIIFFFFLRESKSEHTGGSRGRRVKGQREREGENLKQDPYLAQMPKGHET